MSDVLTIIISIFAGLFIGNMINSKSYKKRREDFDRQKDE